MNKGRIKSLVSQRYIENFIDEALYSIDPGGPEALDINAILIQPNMEYYIGASSSPDHIIVLKVDDRFITYKKYPYKQELKIDKRIGIDLIAKGTKTKLSQGLSKYFPDLAKALEDLLDGKPVRYKVDPEDFERVEVHLVLKDGANLSKVRANDPWYAAEIYGNVGSYEDPTYGTVYKVSTNKGVVRDIKKEGLFDIIKTEVESVNKSISRLIDLL